MIKNIFVANVEINTFRFDFKILCNKALTHLAKYVNLTIKYSMHYIKVR